MSPPIYTKPYPLTKAFSQSLNAQESPNNRLLSLDDATTLAVYGKQNVDSDLKKVVRCLKKPLEIFPQIILHAKFLVTIESDGGNVEQLEWELTIKEAHRSLHCILDALGVIHQSLFHSKILLRGVEEFLHSEERNEPDYSSKQLSVNIEELKKLKENLLRLNEFLDCILLHYSGFEGKLPRKLIDGIKHAAKKVNKVVCNLKPDRLQKLIPDCTISEEDMLCSVLGLNDDFADRLRNLSPEMRKHKTDMYFLQCFLKERFESLNAEGGTTEILKEMGFSNNRSNVIAKWIASQPFFEHKSTLAWAEIYIENFFKYDIFLNDRVPKFPYKEDSLNKWFVLDVDRGQDEASAMPQVSVINVGSKKDAKTNIQKKVAEFKQKNPEGQLYFHGTDHNGAKNVLEDGIKLGYGRERCDFSDGGGFYVADHFEYALDWATTRNKFTAVILFSISPDYLKNQPSLDLRGHENYHDWIEVKNCCRSGELNKLSKTLRKLVKKAQYIIGPISGDGVSANEKWIDVQQICIRKEEMAEEVGDPSSIVGIVFLNRKAVQSARRT